MRACESILASLVWGAWAGVCSPVCAPRLFLFAHACVSVSFGAHYPPRFAVRASDAFSRAYRSPCAFRPRLAVYGPYSEREMGVVGCGGMLMALVARLAVSFLSRVSIKNTPAHKRAGVFFRVGAPYAYSGALRAYRQGRSQSGSMCALPA